MRTRILNHFHTFYPEAQAEHDRLAREERELKAEQARRAEPADDLPTVRKRRMSEPPEDVEGRLAEVRERIEACKATIASGVVRVHIKGLTRGEFRRLLTEHPARDDDALDGQLGYNADTFGDALVKASIVRTENLDGDPVENEWDRWADEMTNGQWEEFFRACLDLTNSGQPVFPR